VGARWPSGSTSPTRVPGSPLSAAGYLLPAPSWAGCVFYPDARRGEPGPAPSPFLYPAGSAGGAGLGVPTRYFLGAPGRRLGVGLTKQRVVCRPAFVRHIFQYSFCTGHFTWPVCRGLEVPCSE